MNRWICRDLYNWNMMEYFGKWSASMKDFKKELGILKIHQDDQEAFFIFNCDDEFVVHLYRDVSNLHTHYIYSKNINKIYDWKFMEYVTIPKKYYYSNGSLPRSNGSIGWD